MSKKSSNFAAEFETKNFNVMKTYLFVAFMAVIVFADILVSCNREPEMPTEVTPQNVYKVLKWYYPYEEGDVLTFKNEGTGATWSIAGKSTEKENFLKTELRTSSDHASSFGWNIVVTAKLTDLSESDSNSIISTNISADTIQDRVWIMWNCGVSLGGYNRGDVLHECKPADIYTYLTDTIILTMRDVISDKDTELLPENSYLYIVRHKGITEFCLDGQTVWKRVE